MKLILHIGTHKTGTTTIQRALSSNREFLASIGVWYPNYCEVIGGDKTNYAHLDLAKALMNENCSLSQDEAKNFLKFLKEKALEKNNVDTIIISAETLLRGKSNSEKRKWTRIESFQKDLRALLVDFEDVEVSVTFRNYFDYLESLYNEHVKATNYSKNIIDFYKEYDERFSYSRIVESWSNNVGVTNISFFKDIKGENIVNSWLSQQLGYEILHNFDVNSSNSSWPLPLVELKRKLNFSMSKSEAIIFREKITNFSHSSYCLETMKNKYCWISEAEARFLEKDFENDSLKLLPYLPNENQLEGIWKRADSNIEYFRGITENDYIAFIRFINGERNEK